MKTSDLLIRKIVPVKPKILDAAERIMEFVISTDTIDRDGDIIEVDGWELDNYLTNPVFVWGHNYQLPALGRALSLKTERTAGKNYLIAVDQFAPGEHLPVDLRGVWDLYAEGYMHATSVGFIPKAYVWEVREDGDTVTSRGYRFSKQELLEHSAVTVPANPDALARAKAAGITVPGNADAGDEVEIAGRKYTVAAKLPAPVKEVPVKTESAPTPSKTVEVEVRGEALGTLVDIRIGSKSIGASWQTHDDSDGSLQRAHDAIVEAGAACETHKTEGDDLLAGFTDEEIASFVEEGIKQGIAELTGRLTD